MRRTSFGAGVCAGAFVLCGLLGTGDVQAQAAKTEVDIVQTTRLTDAEFLRGEKGRPSEQITGELRLPSTGSSVVPAVVILHGSGGILGNEDYWAKVLNEMGVAAFLLDMFTPRPIVSVGANQDQLGFLTMINDAYRRWTCWQNIPASTAPASACSAGHAAVGLPCTRA